MMVLSQTEWLNILQWASAGRGAVRNHWIYTPQDGINWVFGLNKKKIGFTINMRVSCRLYVCGER
eukprot:UN17694